MGTQTEPKETVRLYCAIEGRVYDDTLDCGQEPSKLGTSASQCYLDAGDYPSLAELWDNEADAQFDEFSEEGAEDGN